MLNLYCSHQQRLLQMPGLTKETFLAIKQTCFAIVGLAKYLLNSCGFNYVLLGKIQSDTIEGRFGHIRQLSGANYYISMRQLLENDKKLRTLSLLKYSHISVKEISQAAEVEHNIEYASEVTAKAEELYADIQWNFVPTENDLAVIYYVTGFCCRSLVNTNRCEQCKDATVASFNSSPDNLIPESASEFFNYISRGGLWKPTSALISRGGLWKPTSALRRCLTSGVFVGNYLPNFAKSSYANRF